MFETVSNNLYAACDIFTTSLDKFIQQPIWTGVLSKGVSVLGLVLFVSMGAQLVKKLAGMGKTPPKAGLATLIIGVVAGLAFMVSPEALPNVLGLVAKIFDLIADPVVSMLGTSC